MKRVVVGLWNRNEMQINTKEDVAAGVSLCKRNDLFTVSHVLSSVDITYLPSVKALHL